MSKNAKIAIYGSAGFIGGLLGIIGVYNDVSYMPVIGLLLQLCGLAGLYWIDQQGKHEKGNITRYRRKIVRKTLR